MRLCVIAAQIDARAAKPGKPVHVGNRSGNKEHRCRHARDFIEASASEGDRGECVRDWVHGKEIRLSDWDEKIRSRVPPPCEYYTDLGMARVSASGTMRNSAGRFPAGSPST